MFYTDILHITNMGLVSSVNLTSLKLSVNRIDKICNLDSFTNLVELDLSHNRIKHIENLQVIPYSSGVYVKYDVQNITFE